MIQPNTVTVPNTLDQDFRRVDQQMDRLTSTWNCRRVTCCVASCLICPLVSTIFAGLDCISCLLDATQDPRDREEPCLMTRGACEDCCSDEEIPLPNTSHEVCLQVINPSSSILKLSPLHYSTAPERQLMEDLHTEKRDLTLQNYVKSPVLSGIILDYEG